ncbi:MAG TPA: hypothetical protein VKH41_00360 [Myxococcota bacterium]|nr:hypothetical protein [Myxococcota bacterium]
MRIAVARAGLGSAILTALLAAAALRAPAAGLDGMTGTWVRADRERDDAARDAMIVRATEPMSFAFRGVARGVMRTRMVPSEQYVVERGDDALQIRNDKGTVFPIDGRVHSTGKDREVTSRVAEGGVIEQAWKESDSHGVTTWRLDGQKRLVVSQRIVDPHFEAPLEYSTTYQRLVQ